MKNYVSCSKLFLNIFRFGHSQRLAGNRQAISVVENHGRASITSTQRRVINQLRDRPPRYEREQSVVRTTPTETRDPTNVTIHALGEPPPLYSEVSDMQSETRIREIEPPPAYTADFPTIDTMVFANEVSLALTEEEKVKDEVASGTSMEGTKEDKLEVSSLDTETNLERNVR